MMTNPEIRALLEQGEKGKQIERCYVHNSCSVFWQKVPVAETQHPEYPWDFRNYDYRVSRSLLEGYVNEYPDDRMEIIFFHRTLGQAIDAATSSVLRTGVHVREVEE